MGSFLKTVLSFLPSLTITFLNFILPLLFNLLSNFEDWSPRFNVNINLFRYVRGNSILIFHLEIDGGKLIEIYVSS